MLDETTRNLIVEAIRGMVAGAELPAEFRELILIPLSRPHKPFGTDPEWPWSALVVAAAHSASAGVLAATTVAAAVECALAAADVFDEIEDGDASDLIDRCGAAQALNVAGALLSLAYLILADLKAEEPHRLPQPLLSGTMSRFMLQAAAGQHVDLANEGVNLTSDEALDSARSKAGALGAMACRLGALIHLQDEELLTEYEHFGRHLATAGQIANDLRDAGDTSTKSDLARGKSTLPLLIGHRSIQQERSADDAFDPAGALGWVVVEYELQLARQAVDRLNGLGVATSPLVKLLE